MPLSVLTTLGPSSLGTLNESSDRVTTIKQFTGDGAGENLREVLETRNMIQRVILAEYEKIIAQGDPEGQTKS